LKKFYLGTVCTKTGKYYSFYQVALPSYVLTICLFIKELEAYGAVVSALRAQGDLTKERRKVLVDLGNLLNVQVDRHKAEIRRALNDETLATVARW